MAYGVYGDRCISGHTAYIYDRGGLRRLGQILDISQIQWQRDRDGVSEADIRIEGSACSMQADLLANIEPKRHELVIFRGSERVWEGPVWRVGWHSDYVEINAHDIFEYVAWTPLSREYDNSHPNTTEVTTRVNTILQYELGVWEALDPPANIRPHIVIHHFAGEASTTAVTKPYEMTVGEHIQDLAHYSGIDFTCVGRALHVWDVSNSIGRTRRLTEADFQGSEVIITAYGSEHTQSAIVVGRNAVYGKADATQYTDYYGPWTKIYTAYNEEGSEDPTQAELTSQAQRNLAGKTPVPTHLRIPNNSSLILTETLTINDLVPGVIVPVTATLNVRTMSSNLKLDHLTVIETPEREEVKITLIQRALSSEED